MAKERAHHRLAAILAADVVGYSRLMEQDEAGTLALLKARRKEVLEPLVAKHQGRVFKVTGDGVLVEFGSAVNAVGCTVDLQQGLAAQLIEAASGTQLWAERYDRDLEGIFAVQDEVGATIIATLIGRLAARGAEQAPRKPPQLWAAYDYFIQGREQMQRFDAEAAAPLLRHALESEDWPTQSGPR